MAQPIKDGVILSYVKDGVVYPVIISEEGDLMLQSLISVITGGKPLQVVFSEPQGQAFNLVDTLRKEPLN